MLIDDMWKMWLRLGPYWTEYFGKAGLDLSGASRENFAELLGDVVTVEFSLKGLEDFSRKGDKGIEPGDPARSLFYHVLASPHVVPDRMSQVHFPRMEELELIENYIYSNAIPTLSDLSDRAQESDLAIVVFAYEYAPAPDTVHKRHADLVFSRTGISRVGNARRNYVPEARGFFPHSSGGKVHVVPTRFGAFVAVQRLGNARTIGPLRFHKRDGEGRFWVPLHKLFNGTECIASCDIKLHFDVGHVNQKIRKVHLALQSEGVDTGWSVSDMHLPPFVITKDIARFEAKSGLVVPVPHDPLLQVATAKKGGKKRFVGFRVPPKHKHLGASLWFPDEHNARRWPEFVHAKHEIVTDTNSGRQRIVYLPETRRHPIETVLWKGGYEAANFIDWTADGWVAVRCPALNSEIRKRLPAYSIVAQPDFFPLVKQQDLMDWWEGMAAKEVKQRVWPDQSITPASLSGARYPPNITLPDSIFDSSDRDITAIVGFDRKPGVRGRCPSGQPRRETTLSYKATSLFEPGWDVSEDFNRDAQSTHGTYHLANYGLGSPFAEDTLICAAFGAFWPAAVPDITRFFSPDSYPSITPIMDEQARWSGVSLPILEDGVAHFQAFDYADYVRDIREGILNYEQFAEMTLEEYISRTAATARVFQYLRAKDPAHRLKYPILSFRHPRAAEFRILKANRWRISVERTYRFEVARLVSVQKPKITSPKTRSANLDTFQVLYASESSIAYPNSKYPGKWCVRKF